MYKEHSKLNTVFFQRKLQDVCGWEPLTQAQYYYYTNHVEENSFFTTTTII